MLATVASTLSTGQLDISQWKFEAPSPDYETPYTNENLTQVYSSDYAGKLCDGMLFVSNSEHSPTSPVTRGWSTMGYQRGHRHSSMGHVGRTGTQAYSHDGYMTASNNYDGYMYVYGMGISATKITTSPASHLTGSNHADSRHSYGHVSRTAKHTMRL